MELSRPESRAGDRRAGRSGSCRSPAAPDQPGSARTLHTYEVIVDVPFRNGWPFTTSVAPAGCNFPGRGQNGLDSFTLAQTGKASGSALASNGERGSSTRTPRPKVGSFWEVNHRERNGPPRVMSFGRQGNRNAQAGRDSREAAPRCAAILTMFCATRYHP
jgi:hypothetical protein